MVKKLIRSENHVLSDNDLERIGTLSEGYSGADMKSLCQEASLGPIRSISFDLINNIKADQVNTTIFLFFFTIIHKIIMFVGTPNEY